MCLKIISLKLEIDICIENYNRINAHSKKNNKKKKPKLKHMGMHAHAFHGCYLKTSFFFVKSFVLA